MTAKCSMQKKKESLSKKNEKMDFNADNVEDFLKENFGDYTSQAKEFISETNPDDEIYDMDELDDILGDSVSDGIRKAFYGYDYNPHDDGHNRESFNPNRSYFFFNGYANLVSVEDYYYEDVLKRNIGSMYDFAEWMIENYRDEIEDAFNDWSGNSDEEA